MSYKNCTVHKYSGNLVAMEHSTQSGVSHENLLIFISGLGDGITTVPYVRPLAEALDKLGWGVAEILTRSSFTGFGGGSLVRDNEDVTNAVTYFYSEDGGSKKKIVIAGHSTGSQNVMYYLTQQYPSDVVPLATRPKVYGGILQAGASDREAIGLLYNPDLLAESIEHAKDMVSKGLENEMLPLKYTEVFFGARITAYRWLSFVLPRGDDDYFSSDLTAEDHAKTYGKVSTKLLVAYSGKDEFVPEFVDKDLLVSKWKKATDPSVWSEYSGVIPGARHAISQESSEEALPCFIERVSEFLASV